MSLEEGNYGQSMPDLHNITSYVTNLSVNRGDNFDICVKKNK